MAVNAKIHEQLHRLNIISASAFTLLAICAGVLMGNTSFPLVIGHVGKDELASQSTTAFAPAIHHLMNMELRWSVVAILALGVLFSVLLLTRWHDRYHTSLRTGVRPLRWLGLAILFGLMTEVAATFAGVQDVVFLKIIAGLVVLMCGFGWLSEKQDQAETRKPVWSAFLLGSLAGLLPWLVILTSLVGTSVYGVVRQPWYVYSLYGVLVAGFLLIWLNLYYQLRRLKSWARPEFVERNYAVLHLIVVFAFGLILTIGLHK